MRKITNKAVFSGVTACLMSLFLLTACGDEDDGGDDNLVEYSFSLSGEQSVPSVETTATGTGEITYNEESGQLSGSVTVTDLDGVTAAHIHTAFAGSNGTNIITLTASNNDTVFSVPSDLALTSSQADSLARGELYVNIHTADHPNGEIRGQILPSNTRFYPVTLTGAQEVPANESSATGTGAITVNTSTGAVYGSFAITGIDDASAAHIHQAFAGSNGSVVLALEPNDDSSAFSFGDGAELDADALAALRRGELYVNVHSASFADGEIRGQILPSDVEIISFNMDAASETSAVDSDATAIAVISLNTNSGALYGSITMTGIDDASAAHVHTGYAGFADTETGAVVSLELSEDGTVYSFPEGADLTSTEVQRMLRGQMYMNVHTATYQTGEIRGQALPDALSQFQFSLSGDQQVPSVLTSATGSGTILINRETGDVSGAITTAGVDDATAAHIHVGAAGATGAAVITLQRESDDSPVWNVPSSANLADDIDSFLEGGYYINVHTPANPDGEIRGQIVNN